MIRGFVRPDLAELSQLVIGFGTAHGVASIAYFAWLGSLRPGDVVEIRTLSLLGRRVHGYGVVAEHDLRGQAITLDDGTTFRFGRCSLRTALRRYWALSALLWPMFPGETSSARHGSAPA